MSQPPRPNILFLMSDQHRADVAGFAGDPVVRTPVLDALARTGVVFSSAYTPSPLCIPGRQAMMSGQLPRTCRCEQFGEDLAPGHMTFARRFAQYAYHCVCAGKLHHLGPDQMQGWTDRVAPDTELGTRFIEGRDEAEFARYRSAPGTGKWSNQKELERAGVGCGPYQRFDRLALAGILDYVERHFADPWYDRPRSPRPLLLKLSLIQPHYPFFTDEARFNYYLNRVRVRQEPRSPHPVLGRTQHGPDISASERDLRRATAAYYGMVETVDTAFGHLLERLRELGQDLDDWLIVYTSDHGEMLGEHGVWEKTSFYEGSARVPLLLRWPRRFAGGRTVSRNVSLCDLFATLCDCAGLPVPPGLDSRSLRPLLEGRDVAWPDEAVSQVCGNRVMIKQGSLKYLYLGPNAPEVLFDLAGDPGEQHDCSGDPAYAAALTRFRQRLGELGFGPQADPHYRHAGYAADS